MAGYLDAQLRERLSYLCKDLVKPSTTQDKIIELAFVAPKGLVAKGSALNNPFRMLPPDVMANIQPMTKSWIPTRTARLMKDLDFHYEEHIGYYTLYVGVSLSAEADGVHFWGRQPYCDNPDDPNELKWAQHPVESMSFPGFFVEPQLDSMNPQLDVPGFWHW